MKFNKKKTTIGVVLALAFALVLGIGPVFAVHDDCVFQIDGDAQEATCGTAFPNANPPPAFLGCDGDDWDTLYTCTADGDLGCTAAVPCDANGNGVLDGTEC